MTEDGGTFRDSDFHAFLKQQGIQREYDPETHPAPHRVAQVRRCPETSQAVLPRLRLEDLHHTARRRPRTTTSSGPSSKQAVAQAMTALGRRRAARCSGTRNRGSARR